MARQKGFSPDILKVCREVLDHLKNDSSGRPKKQLLVVELETVLDAANKEIHREKDIEKHNSPYFGQLGKHYDMTLTVKRAHRRNYGYRMECIDWKGRNYVVRAKNDAISVCPQLKALDSEDKIVMPSQMAKVRDITLLTLLLFFPHPAFSFNSSLELTREHSLFGSSGWIFLEKVQHILAYLQNIRSIVCCVHHASISFPSLRCMNSPYVII